MTLWVTTEDRKFPIWTELPFSGILFNHEIQSQMCKEM